MDFFYDAVEKTMAPHVAELMADTVADEIAEVATSEGFAEAVEARSREAVAGWVAKNLHLEQETRYVDVFDFFDSYLSFMFPQTSETNWSARWWAHPAVLRRVMLMWGSFEAKVAAAPATGEEEWLRTIGHFHMNWLTQRHNGPFERTKPGRDVVLEPLASDPVSMQEVEDE